MAQLVLLGGPPGVGKSTVLKSSLLNGFSCLEADDIWAPNKIGTRQEAISEVIRAVKANLSSSNTVILSWVFARSELYTPFYNYFANLTSLQSIYLVCDSKTLASRLEARGTATQEHYSLEKFRLIHALPFKKIDTTGKAPEIVAQILINTIQDSI